VHFYVDIDTLTRRRHSEDGPAGELLVRFAIRFGGIHIEVLSEWPKARKRSRGHSEAWARDFCRIRGYIFGAKKNSFSDIEVLTAAFEGKPFTPVPVKP